jgi:aminoglycoside phosphotransferase (APT) family kinase protein
MKVLARLEALPEGQNLCHGDYHPGNVLITKKGPVVIDWMTACTGSLWADVARSSLLLSIGAQAAGKQVRSIIRLAVRLYHDSYLTQYRRMIPDRGNELERWSAVIAAARLGENINPEREALIKLVKEGING